MRSAAVRWSSRVRATSHAVEKVQQFGGHVVACSDTTGRVHDPDGIDVRLLKELKLSERASLSEYPRRRGRQARFVPGGGVWNIPCHVALPCATQNELTGRDAQRLVENGVRAVGEGANMPCTPEALDLFASAGVAVAPAKAANAGGVATSALEMQQNASRDSWSFEQTEQRPATDHARHPRCLPARGRGVRHARGLSCRREHRGLRAGG
jgi:glutamate dehydrogenase (NADP+)